MTKALLLLSLGLSLLPAADRDFNGRWNIQVQTERGRVWWLEVQGAGSGTITGSFVGAPGGQVDALENPAIANGELRFTFVRGDIRQDYRATFANGKLSGTMDETANGTKKPAVLWTAARAPEIKDKDDGHWKDEKPVALFNGKDVSNWHLLRANRPGWQVKDGSMVNDAGASDIASDAKFWNFILRAEFRYSKGSNSGIGLRARYEIQIYDNYGKPPDQHGTGALYSRIAPSTNASRAAGVWQQIEARLVGRTLTVKLNGVTIIDHADVVGPTAITTDANEAEPGPIVLQGDHGPIEFRKVEVIPLTR